jgi:hypothetical protein
MSGKSRALAVAAATAGIMVLWVPSALASTSSAPVNANSSRVSTNNARVSSSSAPVTSNSGPVSDNNAPVSSSNTLISGGLINSGPVNVNLGSGDTADNDTCNNTNEGAPLDGNILSWAVGVTHNDCLMAGGPAHF